jgi:hypothetical protein
MREGGEGRRIILPMYFEFEDSEGVSKIEVETRDLMA